MNNTGRAATEIEIKDFAASRRYAGAWPALDAAVLARVPGAGRVLAATGELA